MAGHSLGEYSALAAAGSFSISDTARLLRTRGLAMQKAVPVGVGAMAALLGLDYEAAVAGRSRFLQVVMLIVIATFLVLAAGFRSVPDW